jgi:uncharacterized membrane protein
MGQMMGGMMGQMMGGGMMGPGTAWGGLSWFGLFAVGAIVLAGLAIAYAIVRRPPASTGEDPNEILRRRFARGELSAEDFAAAKKVLG